MKIALLIIGLVFLFISSILEKEKEFSWRLMWRDFFSMTGAIFMFEFWLLLGTDINHSKVEEEQPEPITVTLISSTPEIVIYEILEKEFEIQKLDTINDTTYVITLCKQQKNEK